MQEGIPSSSYNVDRPKWRFEVEDLRFVVLAGYRTRGRMLVLTLLGLCAVSVESVEIATAPARRQRLASDAATVGERR